MAVCALISIPLRPAVYASKSFKLDDGRQLMMSWVLETSVGCTEQCTKGTAFTNASVSEVLQCTYNLQLYQTQNVNRKWSQGPLALSPLGPNPLPSALSMLQQAISLHAVCWLTQQVQSLLHLSDVFN